MAQMARKPPLSGKRDLLFRFTMPREKTTTVAAIVARNYDKRLETAVLVNSLLIAAVPFPFEVVENAQVQVLGGQCLSGHLSIELVIKYRIKDEEAVKLFLAEGFTEGLELTAT